MTLVYSFFPCYIFVWFYFQGINGLTERLRSVLTSFMFKDFVKICYQLFFKHLVDFASETICPVPVFMGLFFITKFMSLFVCL